MYLRFILLGIKLPVAVWKTGEEHAKMHESCNGKSGLFPQMLISECIVKTLIYMFFYWIF